MLVLCLPLLAMAHTTGLTAGHVSCRDPSRVAATSRATIAAHNDQDDHCWLPLSELTWPTFMGNH